MPDVLEFISIEANSSPPTAVDFDGPLAAWRIETRLHRPCRHGNYIDAPTRRRSFSLSGAFTFRSMIMEDCGPSVLYHMAVIRLRYGEDYEAKFTTRWPRATGEGLVKGKMG